MKIRTRIPMLLLTAFSASIYAQSATTVKPSPAGVLGYLDPKTGAFRPIKVVPDISNASTAPTTGKLVANITVAVQSALPSSAPISCLFSADTEEVNSTTYAVKSFLEETSVTATRTGNTATCSVSIPYSWLLSTPASDSVSLSVEISAYNGTTLTRISSVDLGAIAVPANGATTTETVSTVL